MLCEQTQGPDALFFLCVSCHTKVPKQISVSCVCCGGGGCRDENWVQRREGLMGRWCRDEVLLFFSVGQLFFSFSEQGDVALAEERL